MQVVTNIIEPALSLQAQAWLFPMTAFFATFWASCTEAGLRNSLALKFPALVLAVIYAAATAKLWGLI